MGKMELSADRFCPLKPKEDTSCTVNVRALPMSSHLLSKVSILARLKLSTLKPTPPMSLSIRPAFSTRSLENENLTPMRFNSSTRSLISCRASCSVHCATAIESSKSE